MSALGGVAALFFALGLHMPQQVTASVSASPQEVTIGDPISVTVRVLTPLNAEVIFPAGPDSASVLLLLDPVIPTRSDSAGTRVHLATYRVAAWDIPTTDITLPNVRVTMNNVERVLELPAVPLIVQSVLPSDSAGTEWRPERKTLAIASWWWLVLFPLFGLAAALFALYRWWHGRRPTASLTETPMSRLQKEFDRIAALRLLAAGEGGRHVVLMAEALHDACLLGPLAPDVPGTTDRGEPSGIAPAEPPMSWEDAEKMTVRNSVHPRDLFDRLDYYPLADLLADVELIKFAALPLDGERAAGFDRRIRLLAESLLASELESEEPRADEVLIG